MHRRLAKERENDPELIIGRITLWIPIKTFDLVSGVDLTHGCIAGPSEGILEPGSLSSFNPGLPRDAAFSPCLHQGTKQRGVRTEALLGVLY